MFALTEAILLLKSMSVEDEDQRFLLSEMVRCITLVDLRRSGQGVVSESTRTSLNIRLPQKLLTSYCSTISTFGTIAGT